MKTLSAALTAAQKSSTRNPAIRAIITNQRTAINKLEFTGVYSGAESVSVHAAAVAGDGSIIRAYINYDQLMLQRVSSPGPASDFSSWTNLSSTIGAVGTLALALCARGSIVRCFFAFYNSSTSLWEICYVQSPDYGASLSSKVTIASQSYQWIRMAADFNADGTTQLLVVSDGYLPNIVSTLKWSSTSGWGALTAWPHSGIFRWIYGFACKFHEDFNIVFGAKKEYTLGLGGGLWQTVYGNGVHQTVDTWSPLEPIITASGAADIEFRFPQMDLLTENDKTLWRLYCTEMYTGSTSYTRNYHSHGVPDADFIDCLWHDLIPLSAPNAEFAPVIIHTDDYAWLITPPSVSCAPLYTESSQQTDVSSDVIKIKTHQEEFAGHADIELNNDNGQYSDFPCGGQQINISFGFKTSVGAEYPDIPETYWIESFEYLSEGKSASIIIHAVSAWGVLKGWHTRNQYAWNGTKTIRQLLQWLLARVGFDLTVISSTAALDAVSPSFTVYPNETGDTAVRRLIGMLTEKILWRNATACIKYPQESEAACYDYGSTHPILKGNYVSAAFSVNHSQVFGTGVMEERMRWDEISKFDDRLSQVYDVNLTTTEAGWRAMAELRKAWFNSARGTITVPLNPGQELFDNVNVSDPRWSAASHKRRILAVDNSFDTQTSSYAAQLSLGAP